MADSLAQIRFGTRGSALARAQTDLVLERLRALHAGLKVTSTVIRTEGDRDKTTPLTVIGGRGVFTSALQEALRRRRIDAAVHSAKDLPTERPTDLSLAAFLAREDPRDVVVSRHGCPLADLGRNPTIGTSSRRRAVQVRRLRPDAQIVDLRGNIDTRLRKSIETDLDGIVLAAAGVRRMGWTDRITEYLPIEIAVPSPGQGALAVEIRAGETGPACHLSALNETDVSLAVCVERAFLRGSGRGCTAPVGAFAAVDEDEIRLLGMIASDDGERVEWVDARFASGEAEAAARRLAADLRARVRTPVFAFPEHQSDEARPLAGKRVLVTRGGRDDALVELIVARGGEPVVIPTSRIEGPRDPEALGSAVCRLEAGAYNWVIFTSGNAVDQVLARLNGEADALSNRVQVAAVGPATAARLAARGVTVAVVPPRHSGEGLVEALKCAGVRGAKILFPHGDLARETVPAGMEALGAEVDAVEAYRTVAETRIAEGLLADLREHPVDVAVFLSPSSLHNFASSLQGALAVLDHAVIATIGPVTAEAARLMGLTAHVVSPDATVTAIIDAVERYLAGDEQTDAFAGPQSGTRSSAR